MLALAAGIAHFLTFKLNQHFDDWMLYSQGISLLFLPAGIRHLAILLADGWGALGCFVSLLFLASGFWVGLPTGLLVLYSAISTAATWLGIVLSLRLLGIDRGLGQLKFIHLPVIDLITTTLHGFTTNAFFILAGMKSDHLTRNALAMMFGDFAGSFTVLTLLWLGLSWFKRRTRKPQMDLN